MSPKRETKEFLLIIGVYIILTVLVWGLFAFDRGMFQDEMIYFGTIKVNQNSLEQLLFPLTTPTRIFPRIPFTLAHWTGHVIFSLQFLYGLVWFSTGLLVHLLMLQLFPKRSFLAYLAGSLTLCATPDYLNNSILGNAVNVPIYFSCIFFLLKYWQGKSRIWLLPSAIFLYLGIFWYENILASVILTPLLFLTLDNFRFTKRFINMTIFWYVLLIPYIFMFIKFLIDPHSYAAQALLPISLTERFIRTLIMFINNFTPWSWALNRVQWFPALPSVFPSNFQFVITILGTIIFLAIGTWLWHRRPVAGSPSQSEALFLIKIFVICIMMTIVSNGIYSSVHVSEFFYRTHLVSRVWASIAVALLSYGLILFARKRWKYVMMILPTVFLGFGIYGGLERQDYYLGYWRQHKVELRSIVEQIPGLKPDARFILYVPPQSHYLATEATYLARFWMIYLYGDPSLYSRVFLWSKKRTTHCEVQDEAFVCTGEGKEKEVHPIAKSILLIYSPAKNRYILQHKIPSSLLQDAAVKTDSYDPMSQIVNRTLPDYARSILYGPEYLGALFHGKNTLAAEDEIILLKFDSSKVNNNLRAGFIDLFESDRNLTKISITSVIHAAGWAYDPTTKKPIKSIIILLNGKPILSVPIYLNRKDVAIAFKTSKLSRSGWNVVLAADKIGIGKHRLEFYAMLLDGSFAPLQYLSSGKIYFDIEIF